GGRLVPVAQRDGLAGLGRQFVDDAEPVAPEDVALVLRLPVAVLELAPRHRVEFGKALAVFVLVEVGVVGELGADEDPPPPSALLEEALEDPLVTRAARVASCTHPQRDAHALKSTKAREEVGVLSPRELRE